MMNPKMMIPVLILFLMTRGIQAQNIDLSYHHQLLASKYMQENQIDMAKHHINEAIKTRKTAWVYYLRAKIYYMDAQYREVTRSCAIAANRCYKRILELKNQLGQALNTRKTQIISLRRQAAIEEIRKKIKSNETILKDTLLIKIDAHLLAEEPDKAYQTGMSLEKCFAFQKSHYGLPTIKRVALLYKRIEAQAKLQKKETLAHKSREKANHYMLLILEKSPQITITFCEALVEEYLSRGNIKNVLNVLDIMTRNYPKNLKPYFKKAEILEKQKQYAQAIRTMYQLKKNYKACKAMITKIAESEIKRLTENFLDYCITQKKFRKGLKIVNILLKKYPKEKLQNYFKKAMILEKMGKYQEAIKTMNEIKKHSQNEDAIIQTANKEIERLTKLMKNK